MKKKMNMNKKILPNDSVERGEKERQKLIKTFEFTKFIKISILQRVSIPKTPLDICKKDAFFDAQSHHRRHHHRRYRDRY